MADSVIRFFGWQRSGMFALSNGVRIDGRLQAAVSITLRDRDNPVDSVTRLLSFAIAGPRDVAGLTPAAFGPKFPPPDTGDAEVTKCVHIELNGDGLPWRGTPELAGGEDNRQLRPSYVLVVGTDQEVILQPGNQVLLSQSVLDAHPLTSSARWAHVQDDGTGQRTRLLSPRLLQPGKRYIAVVVHAFAADGSDAWAAGTLNVTLPAQHWWAFTAGPAGDFRSLAARLKPGRAPANLGRAPVDLKGVEIAVEMSVRGALAPVGGDDTPLPADVVNEVNQLRTPLADPRGRPVMGLPVYGSEWVADPLVTTWGAQVNTDPRDRGVAGLGLEAGIVLQEMIVAAAAEQVGALQEAAQRIRQLTFGLWASGGLWKQRLPKDPSQRLQLYGPALARIVTPEGTVLSRVTSADRPLRAALFSSAARRVFRPGTARATLAKPEATLPAEILTAANSCPAAPTRQRPGVPHLDAVAVKLGIPSLDELIQGRAPGERPNQDVPLEDIRDLVDIIDTRPPNRPCRPVRIDVLEPALTDAIDPTGPNALVPIRVLDNIDGLGSKPLAPSEICFGLDLPAWRFLRDHAPDWLLPGVGSLATDSVVAVETNPRFVDAFLLGMNAQALAELRWRNLPVASGCTPLRTFWDRADAGAGVRVADLRGVDLWADDSPLGVDAHRPEVAAGADLVLVFRSELFRRYPQTLVYLTLAVELNGQPNWEVDPDPAVLREFPTFQGSIGSDVTFFGFSIPPADARRRWVVLEEPPAGYRFRNRTEGAGWPAEREAKFNNATDGAAFAAAAFDDPVRVLIRGDSLVPEVQK